ncbi:MAG: MAPEG family protein [Pseudomonadota bacterium]
MILPITLAAAGAAALINLWLAIRVGQVRTKEKVMIGDGGNENVIRRMRAHANFTEFTPFVLILIAVIELATGTSNWLWAVSSLYLVGRLLHAFGMDGFMPGRMIGTIITMVSLLGLGGYAIYIAHTSDGAVTEIAPAAAVEAVPAG